MKNNEFKNFLNEIIDDTKNADSTRELHAINERIYDAFNKNSVLTQKQYDAAMLAYSNGRDDWSCSHRKGGLTYDEFMTLAENYYNRGGDSYVECWNMDTFDDYVAECGKITKKRALDMFKRNLDEEREAQAMSNWDNEEFVEVDDREELTPHNPEIMDDETFNKFYDSVVGEFANCESVAEVDEANEFFNSEIAAGVLVLTTEQSIKCANVFMQRRNELAHPIKASKKGGKKMPKNVKKNPAGEQPAQTPAAQPAEQPTTAPAPVEVLKGEVINTKDEAEINAAIDRISSKVVSIGRGYLDIVGDVARLRNLKAWKITGHKSLYDLCADKFGMSRATVGNLEAVFKKYGNPETYTLKDECANMSLREMLSNIAEEKKALKGETAGEPADGEAGDDAGEAPAKKGKSQTLINVTWELAGDDWDIDAILDNIRKQLEANPDAKEAFPDGANVAFTITI